jgi:hypothetical protein
MRQGTSRLLPYSPRMLAPPARDGTKAMMRPGGGGGNERLVQQLARAGDESG